MNQQVEHIEIPESPTNQESIALDQTLMVRKNTPAMLLSNLIGAIPLVVVMLNNGLKTQVLIWLSLHVTLIIVRSVHHFSSSLDVASREDVAKYRRTSIKLIAASGFVWGAAGVLFFKPDLVGPYSFLILTLVCMVSGSMNAASSLPSAFPWFASLTMLPIIVLTLLQGSSFYILMSIAALVYLLMTLIFSRNLSQTIRQSLSLKYANSSLVGDLQVQTELANKANQDKSRFLAAASHDVRQPLHAVNLFADAMEQELTTKDQHYMLGGIRRGLDSVGELFDALLDISSIDAQLTPISKSSFGLAELMEDLLGRLETEAKRKGIALSIGNCQVRVYTDRVLLERILGNLLGNAVNYTEAGEISVFTNHISDTTLALHIKDTGPGIAEEHLEYVFEEFAQVNNPERDRSKGLGLGLAIVRRLAALLEVPLRLDSKLSHGTEFVLELPVAQGTESKRVPEYNFGAASSLQNLVVLIVDNEADILEGLGILLEKWGCNVLAANSAEQAIELAKNNELNLVISDFRMPGQRDGVDLISEIRKQQPNVRGLIVSGDSSDDMIQKARLGKILVLNKPVKPVQLNMAISRTIDDDIRV